MRSASAALVIVILKFNFVPKCDALRFLCYHFFKFFFTVLLILMSAEDLSIAGLEITLVLFYFILL